MLAYVANLQSNALSSTSGVMCHLAGHCCTHSPNCFAAPISYWSLSSIMTLHRLWSCRMPRAMERPTAPSEIACPQQVPTEGSLGMHFATIYYSLL